MSKNADNHYEVLGVSQNASDEEIKQAFHDFAKTSHPDLNPADKDNSETRFKKVSAAYETLKDPLRRQAFDEAIAFEKTHRKAGKRQGRRLMMLFALLLIGPSIILYSVIMSRDEAPVETAATAASDEGTASQSAAQALSATTSDPSDQHRNVSAVISAPDQADTSASGQPSRTPTVKADRFIQSSPLPQENAALPQSRAGAGGQSVGPGLEQETTGGDLTASSSPGQNTFEAEIGQETTAAPERPSRQKIMLAENVDVSGPFADCNFCPLMFIPRRSLHGVTDSNVAVSMSEITITQWNSCAAEGGCPDYEMSGGRGNTPVTGMDEAKADQYASWLSQLTGQTYSALLPEAENVCADAGGRGAVNGWNWMEERPPSRECAAPNGDAGGQAGFRVIRRIDPAS